SRRSENDTTWKLDVHASMYAAFNTLINADETGANARTDKHLFERVAEIGSYCEGWNNVVHNYDNLSENSSGPSAPITSRFVRLLPEAQRAGINVVVIEDLAAEVEDFTDYNYALKSGASPIGAAVPVPDERLRPTRMWKWSSEGPWAATDQDPNGGMPRRTSWNDAGALEFAEQETEIGLSDVTFPGEAPPTGVSPAFFLRHIIGRRRDW